MMQEIPISTELEWAVLSFLVSLVYRYRWSYGHEIRPPSKLEGREILVSVLNIIR